MDCARGVLTVCLWTIAVAIATGVNAQQNEGAAWELDVAEEWVRAAMDRHSAGVAQQLESESLLAIAQELRKKGYLEELDRRTNMARAGEMEFKAGELQFLASQNHEKASANWAQAAREFKRAREREKEREATASAASASARSLDALDRAAEAYELATEAYNAENGADNVKSGLAAERAAQCREVLAGKKPAVPRPTS